MTNQEKIRLLEELKNEHGGVLTPRIVIDAARDPTYPMYSLFPWNDAAIGDAHRLNIARRLIASLTITTTHAGRIVTTVAYVRAPQAEARVQGYVSISEIAQSRNDTRAVLLNELSAIEARIMRAIKIAAALNVGVATALEGLLKVLATVKRLITNREVKQ
jgi:hypothetical protein